MDEDLQRIIDRNVERMLNQMTKQERFSLEDVVKQVIEKAVLETNALGRTS